MTTNSGIVDLNVGGTVFQTTESTLTRFNGFFRTILETGVPSTKDETGAFFIDRDPTHFQLILNFMRDGNVELPTCEKEIKEISKEAQYYLLTGLVKICSKCLKETGIVILNVGGTIFQTRKATLRRNDGYFKKMLETGASAIKDKTGVFFIDRSPKHFDTILNFMRDGHVQLPTCENEIKEISKEAQYYSLTGLVKICSKCLKETEIVKLNVGGTMFETTKYTLRKYDGYFKKMLATGASETKDKSGAFFLDCPPKHFDTILNFMRDGDVELPTCQKEIKEILREAKHYSLNELIELCSKHSPVKPNTDVVKVLHSDTTGYVKLNVGGTIFRTTKSTLSRFNGFFKTMMEVNNPADKDETGAFYIDREPTHFQLILNFMRYGDVKLPAVTEEIEKIEREAEYYYLTELVYLCSEKIREYEYYKEYD